MRIQKLLQGAMLCTLALFTTQNALAVSIAIAGDSMACNYSSSLLIRGWGQELPNYFTDDISILNFAECGHSTKSFLNGSAMIDGTPTPIRWNNLLSSNPDYVLISFGWNDQGSSYSEVKCTMDEYKANLATMIDDALAIGAKPILITTPTNRAFFLDGSVNNTIKPNVDAMIEVAAAKSVPVFDLNSSIISTYHSLGPEGVKAYGFDDADTLHFGEYGANQVALMIQGSIIQQYPALAQYAVPEPCTLAMLLSIAFGGLLRCRRRA